MLSQVERRQSVAKIEEQERENQSDENIEPKDIYTRMKNLQLIFSNSQIYYKLDSIAVASQYL